MTFDEIELYEAVHDVYRIVDKPRADDWFYKDSEKLCRVIREHLNLNCMCRPEQMLKAWALYGKSPTVGDYKKLELLVIVARLHGRRCFWANRGLGACSTEATVDRLVPGSRGGLYTPENCVLACSYHNSRRSDMTVEEYLATGIEPCVKQPS